MRRCTRPSAAAAPVTRSSICASSIWHPSGRTWSANYGGPIDAGSCEPSISQSSPPRDGRIIGVEALLRWAHPFRDPWSCQRSLVPLAEQSGLITEIGRWVLEQACPDRHRWAHRATADELTVAVNVSAHQLMSPDFAGAVDNVLSIRAPTPGC